MGYGWGAGFQDGSCPAPWGKKMGLAVTSTEAEDKERATRSRLKPNHSISPGRRGSALAAFLRPFPEQEPQFSRPARRQVSSPYACSMVKAEPIRLCPR